MLLSKKYKVNYENSVSYMNQEEFEHFLKIAVLRNKDVTEFEVVDRSKDEFMAIADRINHIIKKYPDLCSEILATALRFAMNSTSNDYDMIIENAINEWIK